MNAKNYPGRRPGTRRGRPTNRTGLIVGALAAVVVVAALVIAIVVNSGSSGTTTPSTTPAADTAQVVAKVTGIPATVLAAVTATAQTPPAPVNGTAITQDGKPEVLYIGAEYCPFCAAERWPLLIALSRFGTFANVGITHSSSTDVHPNTATVTFHGATFTSQYIAFTAVEVATNQPDGNGGYTRLDTPTAQQQQIATELSPGGSIPFIDLGGHALISGASYDPGILQGQTATQIADALNDPTTNIAKNVIPVANAIIATICQLTGNQPTTACA